MASDIQNGVSNLTSIKKEFVKQHIVLDGSNNPTLILMAPLNAKVGDKVPAVAYKYIPATSVISDRAEGLSTWLQAYEDEYVALKAIIEA